MQVRFIGDVHAKWDKFKKLIKDCDRSLQVGDFGVGFTNVLTGEPYSNPPYDHMKKGEHYFIRGNHDNPNACKRHPFWVKDGNAPFNRNDFFCLGGALSIDRERRTEGYDWWHDEELSYRELCSMLDAYELIKPKVVVTHDCPTSVIAPVMHSKGWPIYEDGSRTRQMLQNMFEVHQPEVWVHGHFHVDYHRVVKGTEFFGLGELSHIDLEV